MMGELVERMARAICESDGETWDGQSDEFWRAVYRKEARAALASIRDIPALTIMEASKGGTINITSNGGVFWRAIIDSELGDA